MMWGRKFPVHSIGWRVFTREHDGIDPIMCSGEYFGGYSAALERVLELFDNCYPGLLDSVPKRHTGRPFVLLVGDGDNVAVEAVLVWKEGVKPYDPRKEAK